MSASQLDLASNRAEPEHARAEEQTDRYRNRCLLHLTPLGETIPTLLAEDKRFSCQPLNNGLWTRATGLFPDGYEVFGPLDGLENA